MNFETKLKAKDKYSGHCVVVIVGPTASGKSEAAVRLAKKIDGEVISADSRQVYRGLDIGTGKVPISFERSEKTKLSIPIPASAGRGIPIHYKGVRHWMIDVASPRRQFSAARFQKMGQKALRDILRRGKLPIICGGTGFYVDALLSSRMFPNVSPQTALRKYLEKKSAEELFTELKRLNSERAVTIDCKNKRRLIRGLEIALSEVRPQFWRPNLQNKNFEVLKIGLLVEREELKRRIKKRFLEWMREGFLDEVQNLRNKQGLSWRRIEGFGLNYRTVAEYLQGKISKDEMILKSAREIYKYAKRQMTWFRRDKEIQWVPAAEYKKIEKIVLSFYTL